jgi:hypothetical protein
MVATKISRVALLALALATASCTASVREGTGTSFLIIESITATAGESDEDTGFLLSDVLTGGGVINDSGSATFRLGLKDPGPASAPLTPTVNQFITVNRYHIKYVRSDGRNVQGADVPYEFDGACTVTVTDGGGGCGFLLVRHTAKREPPLAALANDFVKIETIAEITFYGRDQTGHEASVTGRILVSFGNFADPE